jgi:AcrR family transcriptional regulator
VTEDTRAKIQAVALELFTEQGYENTSLREIAERLGVTKAALYYHFKSKEEIVDGFFADQGAAIDTLLEWAAGQPRTMATRQELMRRYADLLHSPRNREVMRFFERNQAVLRSKPAGEKMRGRLGALVDLVVERDWPLTEQIRGALAIFAMHTSLFAIRDPEVSDDERRKAALEVAIDLLTQAAGSARDGSARDGSAHDGSAQAE